LQVRNNIRRPKSRGLRGHKPRNQKTTMFLKEPNYPTGISKNGNCNNATRFKKKRRQRDIEMEPGKIPPSSFRKGKVDLKKQRGESEELIHIKDGKARKGLVRVIPPKKSVEINWEGKRGADDKGSRADKRTVEPLTILLNP